MTIRFSNARRLPGLVRSAVVSRASLAYLGVVAATALFVAVDSLFVHQADVSLAGVWLFLLAAPAIFVFMIAGSVLGDAAAGSAWFLYPSLVVSVLVQAVALGLFVRLLRAERHSPRPHGA